MGKARSLKVTYQESGGGWGNPLLGRVFDSDDDVSEDDVEKLADLVGQCDLSVSGEMEGRPPTDTPSFELKVEKDESTIDVTGDMLRADEKLQTLIHFIRERSRKGLLK